MGPDPPDHPSVGLIGNLFNAILDSCVNACQILTPTEQLRRLRSESERLFLWGDGVSAADGRLDIALANSSELYQAVISSLYELGKVVNNDRAQVLTPSVPANPPTETHDLQRLLVEAGAILNAPNALGDHESLSDDENGPYILEDVLDDMTTYIDCLMDLSLALENIHIYPKSNFDPTATETVMTDPMQKDPTHTGPTVLDLAVNPHQEGDISQRSLSTVPAGGHALSLGIDDSGLPGFQAKITLFEGTAQERVVNLGSWEVQESSQRRVIWQGRYHNEVLEHYFPSNEPSDLHPHTLQTRERSYVERERYITFLEPHRIRYINDEGVCIHDESISVKYEFTSVESSIQFQGDLRRKDLIDVYDTNLVWTNIDVPTNGSGAVCLQTFQRIKLWRDRFTCRYSLSVYYHSLGRQYHDYNLEDFHLETPYIEEVSNGLRLLTLSQFGDSGPPRTPVYWRRPRRRRNNRSGSGRWMLPKDDREHLAIEFSDHGERRRFIETWAACQTDSRPLYQSSLSNQLELPSRTIMYTNLPQERPQRDAVNLSPGPSNVADVTESSSRQE